MADARFIHFVALASASLTGCVSTKPGPTPDAPVIGYWLPKTAATASGTLTIERCTPDEVALSSTLLLSAQGEATGPKVEIGAAELDSLRFRRQLEVQRHSNGTIASINSTVDDRLPSIIGSVFSSLAQIATTAFASREARTTLCTPAVDLALTRLGEVSAGIRQTREAISSGLADAEDLTIRLNALLTEAASIRQNRLSGTFSVALPESGSTVPLDISSALQDLVREPSGIRPTLNITPPTPPSGSINYACSQRGVLCLPSPHLNEATWMVEVRSGDESLASGRITAPMPQWSNLVELPLRVGFAGSRSFSASYDTFGRQVAARWGSEARGATAVDAISGYVGTATGLADALEGPDELERQKAEIEELETLQRLNRLRACQEILAAGGSACPAEAEARARL